MPGSQFDGLVSEALGVDPKSGGFDVVLGSEWKHINRGSGTDK